MTQNTSYQFEDGEKTLDNGDTASQKSETSPSINDKTPVAKKSEPIKINSKYFNRDFDLGNYRNLISYLYEYQKENAKKYFFTSNIQANMSALPTTNGTHTSDGNLLVKADSDQLNLLNTQLKEKNDKLFEHLKKFEQVQATKDMRHVFYNFDSK